MLIPRSHARVHHWHILLALQLLIVTSLANAQDIENLTGLPMYPRLRTAVMDRAPKTDELGHWCYHLLADTYDSLDAVQEWYRTALKRASESDLTHDAAYKAYPLLSGIKLARDLDYVDIYKPTPQSTTFIQLVKCSPVT